MDIMLKTVISTSVLDITCKQITETVIHNNGLSFIENLLDLHFIDQPLIYSVI